MSFNMILREAGDCYAGMVVILRLEVRQSRGHGAWEVAIIDREQRRSVCTQHDDEQGAREAAELGYRYGSQFGRWKIQRAVDYRPCADLPATPAGWWPAP